MAKELVAAWFIVLLAALNALDACAGMLVTLCVERYEFLCNKRQSQSSKNQSQPNKFVRLLFKGLGKAALFFRYGSERNDLRNQPTRFSMQLIRGSCRFLSDANLKRYLRHRKFVRKNPSSTF